ncbi:MAG: thioredoxin [Candidatus Aminicenantes bacterium]|nr:thioredoxin [Candidatus Aminicenantes bacterium]
MTENLKNVEDSTFEEDVLKSSLPVIVDFWAEWCAPCHMVTPALESIARKYEGKLKVMKMNVDENMKSPSKYGIRSIPTLLFFKSGEVKETLIGAVPQEKIEELITRVL